MKKYKCLKTSAIGNEGDIVSLSYNQITQTRLDQEVIAELKIVEPKETKAKNKPRASKNG